MPDPKFVTSPTDEVWLRRVSWVLAAVLLISLAIRARHAIPGFWWDDAFMFHRYAMNVRMGAGISWNPGGPHTYGLTSPLWLLPVLAGTFTGVKAAALLVSLSMLFAVLALAVLAKVCRDIARTPWLRVWSVVFCLLGYLFWTSSPVSENAQNGMETMLGMTLIGGLIWASRRFTRSLSITSAFVLALVALLSVMTRPESGIVAIMLPVLMWFSEAPNRRLRPIALFLGIFGGMLLIYLLVNRMYFGTAVPLPLYVKSGQGYKGRSAFPNSMGYFLDFAAALLPALLTFILLSSRSQWKKAAVYLLPLLTIIAYLFTVTQIMGPDARYYVPYLPLMVVPAFDALDVWLYAGGIGRPIPQRFAAALLLLLVFPSASILNSLFDRYQKRNHIVYLPPKVSIAAAVPLPLLDWATANRAFASYAASLPGAPSLALTEAGVSGDSAPHSVVLDMAGLNDRNIAMHGATTDYIFAQHVDVIWFPESSYTWLRGQLLTDPRLLRDYEVYDRAFNYDVAIRKDAPLAGEYRKQLAATWEQFYPGTRPDDYRVTAVSWDSTPVSAFRPLRK